MLLLFEERMKEKKKPGIMWVGVFSPIEVTDPDATA